MKTDHAFVARWTAAVGAALLAAELLPSDVRGAQPLEIPAVRAALWGLTVFGVLGLLQALVLGSRVSLWRFVAATALPGTFVTMLALLLDLEPANSRKLVPVAACVGLVTGALVALAQNACIRSTPRCDLLWTVSNALAWGAGNAFNAAASFISQGFEGNERYAALGAGGALASITIGGITGAAALRLIKAGDRNEPTRRADETGQEHGR